MFFSSVAICDGCLTCPALQLADIECAVPDCVTLRVPDCVTLRVADCVADLEPSISHGSALGVTLSVAERIALDEPNALALYFTDGVADGKADVPADAAATSASADARTDADASPNNAAN